MSIQDEVTIGKKGEILAKKQLREISGLSPGDKALVIAKKGELIIKKIYSIKELFQLPVIATGTPEEIEKEIEEENKNQERLSENE